MIIKIMGIFDIITAVVFASFVFYRWFSAETIMLHAFYFGVKGLVFALNDFPSKADVVVALYMLAVAFGILQIPQVSVIAVLWILQKGLFSMLSR